jgi:hypothetical protein
MKIFYLFLIFFHLFEAPGKTLTLDEKGVFLSPCTLSKGMIKIDLKGGKAIKLKLWEKEVGFLYVGEGSWEAKVEEKFALDVLKYNVKNGSHLKLEGNKISDTFKSAMFFGIYSLSFFKGEEINKDKDFEEAFQIYEKEIFDQKLPSPPHFVLNGIINDIDIFGAIFEGGKDEIIYTYDPFWTKEENLYALKESFVRRKGRANIFFENALANQPIGRKREDKFLPPITLIKANYEIDYTNISNILANFKLEFLVNFGEFLAIPLSLPNSDYYVRKGGHLYEEKFLYVDTITSWDGKNIQFIHSNDILTIIFPQKFKQGDIIRLNILYGGNIFEPTPNMSYYINLSGLNWFPSPIQGYESIECLFSGKIKCKKPFYPFASFDEYKLTEENDFITLEGKSKRYEDFHSIAVGKYFAKSKKVLNKFNITAASTVFPNERAYETLFGLSEGILDFYEYFLKGYPYDHLNIIEGRWVGYGHAPAGIVWVGEEVFDPYWDINAYFSSESNETLAHEIAHQYFGHLVRATKWEDTWLEEALAQYMSAFWYGRARGEREFKSIYSYWYNNAKEANDIASIYGRGLISGENSGRYYWDLTYCKGPVLIHSIRKKVGEQTFFTLLRSFLRSFENKRASTKDFIGLLEYLTKEEWDDFFNKYLYGMEMPPKEKN